MPHLQPLQHHQPSWHRLAGASPGPRQRRGCFPGSPCRYRSSVLRSKRGHPRQHPGAAEAPPGTCYGAVPGQGPPASVPRRARRRSGRADAASARPEHDPGGERRGGERQGQGARPGTRAARREAAHRPRRRARVPAGGEARAERRLPGAAPSPLGRARHGPGLLKACGGGCGSAGRAPGGSGGSL